MKYDVLLMGVGGTGVLTTQVIIARAANIEGYYVRGVQLHGLAQRGGIIPAFIRFGSENEVSSPGIMQANADLIIAFEPLEALRAIYYARKDKTIFIINNHPLIPVYSYVLNIHYPTMDEIIKRIEPFAKKIYVFNVSQLSKENFGNVVFGNVMLIGIATGLGVLKLKEESLREAIKITSPREVENNIEAFELGLKLGKEKLHKDK
ncbi:MAG: indolepyruvate oxidoreductase subunit beta [Nitrososphaerota archaeon]